MRCSAAFLFLFFLYSALSPALLHGQEPLPFKTVERHIAVFEPPVYGSPDSPPCLGLVVSSGSVVMSRECATMAKQLMLSGPVTVTNVYGERVGVLPDLSGDSVLQLQAAALPPMAVLFVSDRQVLMSEEDYPRFISGQDFIEGEYFVFAGGKGLEWLPVGVNSVDGSGQAFFLTTVDERLGEAGLKRLGVGSVVVDERGGVLFLVGVNGKCLNITEDFLEANDGTCQLHVIHCSNFHWSSCFNGVGRGTCVNPFSNDSCVVTVKPDDVDTSDLHCRHKNGCGSFLCGCHPGPCSCMGNYGFCESISETSSEPHGCMPGTKVFKPKDRRCENLNPTTPSTKPGDIDKSTLGLVIGLPSGVLALVTATVVTVGIVFYCLHRRAGYETLPN